MGTPPKVADCGAVSDRDCRRLGRKEGGNKEPTAKESFIFGPTTFMRKVPFPPSASSLPSHPGSGEFSVGFPESGTVFAQVAKLCFNIYKTGKHELKP